MTDNLPPDLTAFAQLLDAQPAGLFRDRQARGIRAAFNYCLALMMVEAGKAKLIEIRAGEAELGVEVSRGGGAGE